MNDDSNCGISVDEEVAFWRGFIEWWVREKEEPLPPRAWEALSHAEAKQPHSPEFRSGPVVADQLSICLEKTKGVTAAINSCLDAELSHQDARLNAAYKKALAGVEGENESRLRNSQRQWTKYRDASCDFIGSLTGGTLDSIPYLECLVRETSHRANELEALPL